jgi:urease accessory protein
MKPTQTHLVRIATLAVGFLPALALAHPGHGETSSFVDAMLHPAGGLDHLAGFMLVGMLAASLNRRVAGAMAAAFLGLLVAAWTTDSDGWQYAAGFMVTGAGLVAVAMAATRLLTRSLTAAAPRSPT